MNICSAYGIPIFNNKELIGAFVLQWIDKVKLSNEDIELLKVIANQFGMAINQANHHSQIMRLAEREPC